MSAAIQEYKWQILSIVVTFLVTAASFNMNWLMEHASGLLDATKGPCTGEIVITSPTDGEVVHDEFLRVSGTVKCSASCKAVFLIVKPIDGKRGTFICDNTAIDTSNGTWFTYARLDALNDHNPRAVIQARLCRSLQDYESPGCIRPAELIKGIPSNAITVRLQK